jgi:hypothetical protein
MSVVISEFEVVAEPEPGAAQAPASPPGADSAAKAPAAHELERVAQLLTERALRVWSS